MQERIALKGAGKVIAKWREAKGLSQKDLAIKLGWTKEKLNKVESGFLSIPVVALPKIAKILKHRQEVLIWDILTTRFPGLKDWEE